MKFPKLWRVLLLNFLLLLHLPSHAAEAAFAKWCGSHEYNVNHPLAWPQLKDDVDRLLGENDPHGAYSIVTRKFQAQMELLGGGNSNTSRVAQTFDYYLGLIQVPGNELSAVWTPTRPPGGEELLYSLLVNPNEPLQISCSVFKPDASPSYEQAISYALDAMGRVASGDTLKEMQKVAAAVAGRTYETYERMVFDGLAMWPWEMWLNGKFVPSDFKQPAPLHQLTFFRPNASPAMKFDGEDDSEIDYGFTLEPIGYVQYRDSSYKRWWGISALVTVTDDNGVGYGGLVRWDNLTFGLAYHDKDESNLLFVGIDLYKYILGEEKRTDSARVFLNAVKEKLLEGIED
jgi:hypothetical protein